ncbi:lysophospholipase L1-like esterase [Mycetocola sp. BIGb0189]|uniref:SGNH/GDSL hydrolase family protein n=1 Tax=Mycetocola sp. BIGb0189 TaxID=2940604 RepID=UPI0021689B0E|nr:SGNH/GDSL hydrolase family protein [Mycetocola sp. BIGb0189]MCS4275349.1 lysophospholipase L1-like esterase [Mycetocola sp. BIGb0189]
MRAIAAFLLPVTLMLAGCASTPMRTYSEPPRVLFVGDSLTDGFFATDQESGFKSVVLSSLIEVEPTETALAHQTLTTVSRILDVPERLDLAVVELGTNDVGEKTDLVSFEQQYNSLLGRIRETSDDALLICMGTWTTWGDSYDKVIEKSCGRSNGTYIDLSKIMSKDGTRGPVGDSTFVGPRDDFHPNDLGHQLIAEKTTEVIKKKAPGMIRATTQG